MFIARDMQNGIVDGGSTESYDEWEDVTDNHGEPTLLVPGVWVVRADRDKPHYNIKHGDVIALITREDNTDEDDE